MTSTIPLGELVTIRGGGTPSRGKKEFWDGPIPWATVKDFKTTSLSSTLESITEEGVKNSATNIVPAGSIVVPTRMAVGKAAINTIDLAINQDLKALLPKGEIDTRFLLHFLLSKSDFLEGQAQGATVKGIKLDLLKSLPFPELSLNEQRRIAAILDKADAIRRKREQALDLADEFLKSVFLEMFGDPVTNPKGWDIVEIGDICERVTVGIVVKPASYYVSQGIPALRSLNVREDRIDLANLVFFSEKDNETKLQKTRIWQGDVVVVRSGQPGKAAIVPADLDGANAIDILITTPDRTRISSEYLCAFLNSPAGRRLVLAEERGQIQKHLNVKSLKQAKIPLPPLSEIEKFSTILQRVRENKNKLAIASIEAEKLFASASQRAFSGEL